MSNLSYKQQLAVDAYQLIKNNPFAWNQVTWRSISNASYNERNDQKTRCGSKLCWGGHVVALAGGRFVTDDTSSSYYQRLLGEPGDPSYEMENIRVQDFVLKTTTVPGRLSKLLGIDTAQLSTMTDAHASLEQIREGIKDLLGVDPENGNLVSADVCPCGMPSCTYNKTW